MEQLIAFKNGKTHLSQSENSLTNCGIKIPKSATIIIGDTFYQFTRRPTDIDRKKACRRCFEV